MIMSTKKSNNKYKNIKKGITKAQHILTLLKYGAIVLDDISKPTNNNKKTINQND